MKYLKNIREIHAKYDRVKGEFIFDPSEIDNTITFYLHKEKQGFAMDISMDDKTKLEEILTRNKIDYTISAGNVLPF